MHMSHWRRPPNWVTVCTNETSSLTPTFSLLSAVKEYLRRRPSGCTRMLIEQVFTPPHDHVSLVLRHGFSRPRWRSHARSMLWKLSQVVAAIRRPGVGTQRRAATADDECGNRVCSAGNTQPSCDAGSFSAPSVYLIFPMFSRTSCLSLGCANSRLRAPPHAGRGALSLGEACLLRAGAL
jgi:hypothetical protein